MLDDLFVSRDPDVILWMPIVLVGLFVLWRLPALDIAKIGAVLGNFALGFSALHAWYANMTLLPKPLKPHWLLQLGVLCCGLFFIGISLIVVVDVINTIAF